MTNTVFTDAFLSGVDFTDSETKGVNFTWAMLMGANPDTTISISTLAGNETDLLPG